jgi:hypothetical protein
MHRMFLLLALACSSKSTTVVQARPDSGQAQAPDEDCGEQTLAVVCDGGTAITCDAEGRVTDRDRCDSESLCIDEEGCTACAVQVQVQLSAGDAPAFVPVRPEPTEASFGWERYPMRPVLLSVEDELRDRSVELSLSDPGFAMWTVDGTLLGTEATLEQVPEQILISSSTHGSATLSVALTGCSAGPGTAELRSGVQPPVSGFPLSEFPYLERVSVFNHNEILRVGLDPARHADRVGMSTKITLVDHKTPAEWADDPALIDVSLGEAETHTILADGVQANTVDVWTEAVPIHTGLTRGLDIVFDLNDNLRLDPGEISIGPGDTRPGLTVVGNLAALGPATPLMYERGSPPWSQQRVYYPADIADRGAVPLVVISHGNGHHYTWYDYLGYHLASWGYVVMSHTNNTGPGIETASTTTLTNTESFLAGHPSDEGGILGDHIDASRIIWIGHSRGGEGVVRAYDRLVDEGYSTSFYGPEDIILISSIAPTVFYNVDKSTPHDRPYHLFAGAADGDVHGAPSNPYVQFFRILSAAEGPSQMTYLQGVGHNEFNCCGFADAFGPALIGRDITQVVAKSYYLALVRAYAEGDTPLLDYLSRRADVFRPSAIPRHVIIANTYRPDPLSALQTLDDFQSNSGVELSSAGSTVTLNVSGVLEGGLSDQDGSISYSSSDPMNGMTQAGSAHDENRGLVFEWDEDEDGTLTWLVPDELSDFNLYTSFSFRAAQISRHPNTIDLDGPLSLTVSLVDGTGTEQGVRHRELGQITPPYARSYSGGTGHSNEFNTIRLRLSDFGSGESTLDLSDIVAVRIRVGGSAGSSIGAMGLDDLLLEY